MILTPRPRRPVVLCGGDAGQPGAHARAGAPPSQLTHTVIGFYLQTYLLQIVGVKYEYVSIILLLGGGAAGGGGGWRCGVDAVSGQGGCGTPSRIRWWGF